jgi:hypothetical protein
MRYPTRRRTKAVAVAFSLALLSAGCSHAPGVSNGSVSVCYRAIPVGRAAVHDTKAALIGVHRIPVDQVRSRLPAAAQSELAAEDDTAVCAMSFHGAFKAGQVDQADPGASGQYALVLVSSKKLHLVASLVLPELPPAFRGRTV